jgi:hypothetical protein
VRFRHLCHCHLDLSSTSQCSEAAYALSYRTSHVLFKKLKYSAAYRSGDRKYLGCYDNFFLPADRNVVISVFSLKATTNIPKDSVLARLHSGGINHCLGKSANC